MKVIVDTSTIIDYLRNGSVWQKFLDGAEEQTEVYLSTIAIFELFSGKSTRDYQEERKVLVFLKQFEQIKLDQKIAKRAGELYRELGKRFGPQDYIIAASALEVGGEILTLNTKHFSQIPGLRVYRI